MKRYNVSGRNSFARYGLKGHNVRIGKHYRDGVRL